MTAIETDIITKLLADKEQEIPPEWLDLLKKSGALETGRTNESELRVQCHNFLRLLREATAKAGVDAANPAYTQVRDFLGELSRSRALRVFAQGDSDVRIFAKAADVQHDESRQGIVAGDSCPNNLDDYAASR
jgi:rsbT co-antagonist protein RsbR